MADQLADQYGDSEQSPEIRELDRLLDLATPAAEKGPVRAVLVERGRQMKELRKPAKPDSSYVGHVAWRTNAIIYVGECILYLADALVRSRELKNPDTSKGPAYR